MGHQLQNIFEEKYGCKFLDGELPEAFSETADWLRMVKLYAMQKQSELSQEKQLQYRNQIDALKPLYKIKKYSFS